MKFSWIPFRQQLRSLAAIAAFLALGATVAEAAVPVWGKVTPGDVTAAGLGVQLTGVAYGKDLFVVSTYFGGTESVPAVTPVIFTSPDGANWTKGSLPATTGRLGKVRFLSGKFFVGVSSENGSTAGVLSSSDGVTWTLGALGAGYQAPADIVIGRGGVLLAQIQKLDDASVQVATSPDGVTWTPRTVKALSYPQGIAYFQNQFYCLLSGDGLYSSSDGATWAKVPGLTTEVSLIAVDDSAMVVSSSTDYFNTPPVPSKSFVSLNGTSFAQVTPGLPYDPVVLEWTGGTFAAITPSATGSFDNNAIYGSTNGQGWAQIGITENLYGASGLAHDATHNVWVMTGEFEIFSSNAAGAPGTGGGTSGGGNAGGGTPGGGGAGGGSGGAPYAGGYFSNFSVRARTAAGDGTLILGLVIDGTSATGKSLLVRAAGPALAGYNVAGFLPDPVLGIFGRNGLIDSNDNWESANADLLATIARLGAFGFSAGSKDAIVTGSANPGAYTVHVSGGSGIALAEIYDADGALTSGSAHLVNASARATVGAGDDVFIAGFVVGGTTPHKVVIRAAGPALANFGVAGVLNNPRIDVHKGAEVVASNDDWDAATLADQTAVGAFSFSAGSKDAVVVAELAPGAYSVVVSGVAGATGVAMIELYEMP